MNPQRSLDYVTSVDLWSDIIAMDYWLNIQCLLSFYFTKKKSFLQAKDVLEWVFHGNYVGP